MLTKLRNKLSGLIDLTAKPFLVINAEPNAITILSLITALLALLVAIYLRNGYVVVLLILISGYLDVIDGYVARKLGKVSKVGSFLDSTIDKLNEVLFACSAIILGLNPLLMAIFLGTSLVVSYERAKAESLGMKVEGIGIMERAERILALSVIILLYELDMYVLATYLLIITIVLIIITLVHRLLTIVFMIRGLGS